jgi:hypothetical protein
MLTEYAAVEIYKMKLALLQQRTKCEPASIWGKSRSVAKLFGVNTRTVKYVWNRQTWGHATEHLWEQESELLVRSTVLQRSKVMQSFTFATFLDVKKTNLVRR